MIAYDKHTPWEEHFHEDSGTHYYHNEETGETTWEKPAELM
jgi:hypothetical protein